MYKSEKATESNLFSDTQKLQPIWHDAENEADYRNPGKKVW